MTVLFNRYNTKFSYQVNCLLHITIPKQPGWYYEIKLALSFVKCEFDFLNSDFIDQFAAAVVLCLDGDKISIINEKKIKKH